jgi:DNA-binding transcriptional regulator LsrR (DeoR family)
VAIRHQLGRAAAELLTEVLVDGDVLGLPWSRNVHAVVAALTSLPRVEVVQLTGAIALPDFDSSAVDIVRRAARLSGGRAHVFYAPFVLDSKSSADALRRQRAVVEGLARASAVTKAVVGIGAWQPGESTIHDLLDDAEQRDLASRGVIGELAGVFFDADGKPLRPKVAARLITVSAENLARMPEVIAIVAGASKAAAVRAALEGGRVHGLVVDATLADVLLAG